jgi:hypothetical protein
VNTPIQCKTCEERHRTPTRVKRKKIKNESVEKRLLEELRKFQTTYQSKPNIERSNQIIKKFDNFNEYSPSDAYMVDPIYEKMTKQIKDEFGKLPDVSK